MIFTIKGDCEQMKRKVTFFSNFRIPVFLYLGERYFTDPIVDAEEENQETVDSFFSSAETNFDDEKRAMYAARRKSKSENITFFVFCERCFFFLSFIVHFPSFLPLIFSFLLSFFLFSVISYFSYFSKSA